jgi:hypothetical protein
LLDTFRLYNDLCLEIEILQEQIASTEKSLEYWLGSRIPFGSPGSHKFGINTAMQQTDYTIDTLNLMKERMEQLKDSKQKIDEKIGQFKGLEYKIAYMRYCEGKSLKEIAQELGYHYDYIRQVMSKMRKAQ